jgi:DNA-binding transcriptional regulator YiaG
MPNIGTLLREEIMRLSRKESRGQVDPTKKATAQHRRDIAELRRQVAQLERQVALLSRKVLRTPATVVPDAATKPMRFSAKGLHALRTRMELSANDFGKLIGVSAQSIYNWEQGAANPRAEQLAKLAALRVIGKREAAARLEQLNAAKK